MSMLGVTITFGNAVTALLALGALALSVLATGLVIALAYGWVKLPPVESFVRDFEWTWTNASVVSLILWFISMTLLAVFPSWWLYFADQTLLWRSFWLVKLRDLIASILFGTPFLVLILLPYYLQKWRRKLRGASEARPTGGYR